MPFCPNCGCKVQPGAKFCPSCGQSLAAMPNSQSSASGQKHQGAAARIAGGFADQVNTLAGGEGHVELKFRDFFSSVTKRHTTDEMERVFECGGPDNTPAVKDIVAEWPHPWVWSRVLVLLGVVFAIFAILFYFFTNPNVLPGFMFVGALFVPASVVVFFFEANAPRNVSLVRVFEMFFLGGASSLAVTLVLDLIVPGGAGDLGPSMLTGFVEEVSKFLLVAFFMSRTRTRNYVLTGLLIGSCVGAGFDVFETAGYAMQQFTSNNYQLVISGLEHYIQQDGLGALSVSEDQLGSLINIAVMQSAYQSAVGSLIQRAPTALGGHVVWAAIEGGALGLCEDESGFKWGELGQARFLAFAIMCIVFHGLWDAYIPVLDDISIFYLNLKEILLIIFPWIVVNVLMQRGLAQINELSKKASASFAANGAMAS